MTTDEEFRKSLYEGQKEALKKILNKRKGIRTFSSKKEEYSVMVKETIEALKYILESNEYTLEQEFKYHFKYTEKDIKDIQEFFEKANDEWELVDHSPVFKKHMEWHDYAIANNNYTIKPTSNKYYKKFL